MSFSITVTGVQEAISRLNNGRSEIPTITGTFLKENGDKVVQAYQSTVPVRTGTLRAGMHGRLEGNFRYTGENDVEYGPFIEEGTSRGIPAHHDLKNALDETVSQMQGGQELARRIMAVLGSR